MRHSIPVIRTALLPLTLLASAPAMAAPTSLAAFDRSVAATKQAMMANPEQALSSALGALAIAHRLPTSPRSTLAVLEAEWLHGEALLYLNKLSEAQPIVDTALAEAKRVAPGTKLLGDLLRSHGAVAAGKGDNVQALRDYQQAHEVFRTAGVQRSQAITLQDIGLIYFDAGDYARALDYYDQSVDAYSGDPTLTLTMNNNRAEVLRKQKRFVEAAAAYRAALVEARKLGSAMLQVRILTNLAGDLAEDHKLAAAQGVAEQATVLAQHGEAAGWKPFVYGVAARIAFERGNQSTALDLIGRAFAGADLGKTEMLYREYHEVASRIYEANGDQALALAHLRAFQRLDSEAQALTASAASQLLAARFDFANQNLKISELKQGQLQRDIAMERQKNRFRSIFFNVGGGVIALVMSLLLFGFFSIRRSRDKVRDANTTLSEVNGALEHALKAKTDFLATTSHEIRTPLNGILGMTQVLLADGRVAADVRERIEVVHGAGETMKALVDDILDVAKIESGKLTVVEEPTDLHQILRDAVLLWTGQAEAKGLTLVADVDGVPARILSDGSRLRQIVFNLMSNALKFTSEGAVALVATARHGPEGDTLLLKVSDSGVGIAHDQLDAIFEAFRQADGGTTRQFGGTGLGLAICRSLARAMGGEINVASTVGEGTTFTLRLPLKALADAPQSDAAQAKVGSLTNASLLVVEADPAVRPLLTMLLAGEVADICSVASLAEAIERIALGGIDHVLVDAGAIAGEDGTSTLRDFVSGVRHAGSLCTLTIAPGGCVDVADAATFGATQVVLKPLPAERLIAAMTELYMDQEKTSANMQFVRREAA